MRSFHLKHQILELKPFLVNDGNAQSIWSKHCNHLPGTMRWQNRRCTGLVETTKREIDSKRAEWSSLYLYELEADGDDGSKEPVGEAGEAHGPRPRTLTKQLGGDHHRNGTYAAEQPTGSRNSYDKDTHPQIIDNRIQIERAGKIHWPSDLLKTCKCAQERNVNFAQRTESNGKADDVADDATDAQVTHPRPSLL